MSASALYASSTNGKLLPATKGPGGAPSGKNVFFWSASGRAALIGSRLKPERHTETREVLAAKIDSRPSGREGGRERQRAASEKEGAGRGENVRKRECQGAREGERARGREGERARPGGRKGLRERGWESEGERAGSRATGAWQSAPACDGRRGQDGTSLQYHCLIVMSSQCGCFGFIDP